MTSIQRQEKVQLVRLDPKFMAVAGGIWAVIKIVYKTFALCFALIRNLIFRIQGKDIPKTEEVTDTGTKDLNLNNISKQDTFLSYGGVKWHCLYTHKALKAKNFKSFPKGTAISFPNFELSVFGDLFEEQIQNIEASIDSILNQLKLKDISIKEIHLIKELGKYLDVNGVPDTDIIGFSLDHEGACLMHEEAAMDPDLCRQFLQKIISEEINRAQLHSKSRDTLWNQPESIKERLLHNREYQETDNRKKYGALRGKAIIDLDSPIAGGVYLGAPAREALYVNPESDLLNQIYKNMLVDIRKIKEALGMGFEEKVFEIASKICQKSFPHNTAAALNKLRQDNRIASDEEIELDFFVQNETGDSEHSSLLLAFLLEKLHKEQPNYLHGKVSVDRNWVPGGGHAWVRYTYDQSNIYIIDPLRNYIGRLDNYSKVRWTYERRSDLSSSRVARPL